MPLSPPAVEGLGAANSPWVADERNRVLGQQLSEEGEELHAGLARDAKVKELDAWKSCEVCEPFTETNITYAVVDTRWVRTWAMMEGKNGVGRDAFLRAPMY